MAKFSFTYKMRILFSLRIRSIFGWTFFLFGKFSQKVDTKWTFENNLEYQIGIEIGKMLLQSYYQKISFKIRLLSWQWEVDFDVLFSLFQKCLDKDPAKRWSCERLMGHPLFEDYLAKHKEDSMEHSDSHKSNRSRDKSKVFRNKILILQIELFQFVSLIHF